MKQVWTIWILENGKQKLMLKGLPAPDSFWIEVYSIETDELLEKSDAVNEWGKVLGLLDQYHWTDYETVSINATFTGLISSLRLETGTLPKYKARERILELYDRFRNNEVMDIKRVANEFNVGEETISRDIKILRYFFIKEKKTIVYQLEKNVYKLENFEPSELENNVPIHEMNSTLRILHFYDLFRNQDAIDGDETAAMYGIGKAEFQRDIKILRTFLIREEKTIKYENRLKKYTVIPLPVEA